MLSRTTLPLSWERRTYTTVPIGEKGGGSRDVQLIVATVDSSPRRGFSLQSRLGCRQGVRVRTGHSFTPLDGHTPPPPNRSETQRPITPNSETRPVSRRGRERVPPYEGTRRKFSGTVPRPEFPYFPRGLTPCLSIGGHRLRLDFRRPTPSFRRDHHRS